MLNAIVISHKCTTLDTKERTQRHSEEILHTGAANLLQIGLLCYVWLLFIRFEDYLEVGYDGCALQRGYVP